MTLRLRAEQLRPEGVVRVAREGERVEMPEDAVRRMQATREVVERVAASGRSIYGVTTAVGALKRVRLDPQTSTQDQRQMLERHAVGQGPRLPDDVVRAAMLGVANHLSSGYAGVRPILAQRFVDALNASATPVVHAIGSIGESDLTAMAELSLSVLEATDLAAGEGLALLNSSALSTGAAALGLYDAIRLVETIEVAAALSLEAFRANPSPLDEASARARPYPGLLYSGARVRALLDESQIWEPEFPRHLQDPLSFRCVAHVLGAARDALSFAHGQATIELNASQGNPVVLVDRDDVVSVGNFCNLPLAQALDLARIALASALTQAVERTVKLLEASWSGLPTGLADADRGDPGLSAVGILAAALGAEARSLAQPVSLEVVTSSIADGVEDEMTMALLGARRLAEMVDVGSRIVAAELVVATSAAARRSVASGRFTKAARSEVERKERQELRQWLDGVGETVRSGRVAFPTAPADQTNGTFVRRPSTDPSG